MKALKNYPFGHICDNPILILESDPEWEEAYSNWRNSFNDPPTSDRRWKLGVFFTNNWRRDD